MKVTVSQNQTIVSNVTPANQSVVTAVGIPGPAGPSGITTILSASDVDASQLEDGSVLVYKSDTQKLTATKQLESQNIEAGQY